LTIDSVEELIKFEWSKPLRRLCDQCIEKNSKTFLNAVIGYETYFEYLLLIWIRYIQEFKQYDEGSRALDKLIPKSPGVHEWSAEERHLYGQQHILLKELLLDYESFVIFASVLMNKLARLAQVLIGEK
jgi:hypothetical protein